MKRSGLHELADVFRRIRRHSLREKIRLVAFALLVFFVCEIVAVVLDALPIGVTLVFFFAAMAFGIWGIRKKQ